MNILFKKMDMKLDISKNIKIVICKPAATQSAVPMRALLCLDMEDKCLEFKEISNVVILQDAV